jgi:hypothetical protein
MYKPGNLIGSTNGDHYYYIFNDETRYKQLYMIFNGSYAAILDFNEYFISEVDFLYTDIFCI